MSNNKYEKAKVYKIWSTQGDKIYVGSTCKEYLSQRMIAHRKSYKQWKSTSQKFVTSYLIFDEYGLNNCFIELLEAKICSSKDDLRQLEGKYIRELVCVNKRIAGRSKNEWKEDNPEYQQEYYEINKDKKKEFYSDNKETILNHRKQYYDENKEKIIEQHLQKFTCECGSTLRLSDKSRHLKSMKHCKFIESQNIKPEVDEV